MSNWQLIECWEGGMGWGLKASYSGLGECRSFQLSVKAGLLRVFSPASKWWEDRLLLLNELTGSSCLQLGSWWRTSRQN